MTDAAKTVPFPARRTLRSLADLTEAGLTTAEKAQQLQSVADRYAIAITPEMADLINPADPHDPIARQFVPDSAELTVSHTESADPIGDDVHEVVPGLIHRYPDRVLLKFVNVCAVYCRFCFRREMVGPQAGTKVIPDLDAALAYIRNRPEVWEVVVSGGDPLVAAPRRIAELIQALAAVPHVRIVRFHTRVPVVAPGRVTAELVASLEHPDIATWVAVHANHPAEFTGESRAAIARLAEAGIPLVSQTVLLASVNDDAETLAMLMRTFVENRIKPYYLHHGDLAPGTSHFRTTIAHGRSLMKALRGHVSGLCQPTYVLDIPGGHGKAPIGPSAVDDIREPRTVEDFRGQRHCYPPE
ncbi:lysine-2,3-aminomutase-like protein [Bauldia sp.]|uniref:lysine-2,3-aminomutase-like protein n=1 Tax=Bauldia sp. TaxID=2575872 RepID=UPI003BAC6059